MRPPIDLPIPMSAAPAAEAQRADRRTDVDASLRVAVAEVLSLGWLRGAELVDVTALGYEAQAVLAPPGVPTATLGYDVDFTFLGCGYALPDPDPYSGCETPRCWPTSRRRSVSRSARSTVVTP